MFVLSSASQKWPLQTPRALLKLAVDYHDTMTFFRGIRSLVGHAVILAQHCIALSLQFKAVFAVAADTRGNAFAVSVIPIC